MVQISYNTVLEVSASWDRLKVIPNYQERAGALIFDRLFDLEREVRVIYKFTQEENVEHNPKFAHHARAMVEMIDCAVAMLGPDLEPLEEELVRLGRRHVAYGVSPRFLPLMEKAAIYAMEVLLPEKQFSRSDRHAWQLVFYFMIKQMSKGMAK